MYTLLCNELRFQLKFYMGPASQNSTLFRTKQLLIVVHRKREIHPENKHSL
jgi:hypothetical protein